MQKVLVTGASVGIGRQIAIAFARRNAHVVINYKKSEKEAEETLRLVNDSGGKGYLVQADVALDTEATRLVDEAVKILGRLDVLVNNAGVTKFIPFSNLDSVTAAVWDDLYKINVESVFFCSRADAKIMEPQDNGGCIINLASISGMLPRGSSIPYSVSKAAIIHLTKCLAQVLAPKIRVNSISPGTIQNTRWNGTNPNFDLQKYRESAESIPLKRLGEPTDIAEAAVYLASESAGYITGINLPVEGGLNIVAG
jgi:3-oxoacyl-[acyl-carrier protein] reductase